MSRRQAASSGWVGKLCYALEYNDQRSVEQLIVQGVNINHVFKESGHKRYGQSPIFIPVCKNNRDMVTLLVKAGASLTDHDSIGDSVLLHGIRKSIKLSMIKHIVLCGANVNHYNNTGESAAFLAVKYGRKDILDYLICIGANVEIPDQDGHTPLIHALEFYEHQFSTTKMYTRQCAPSNILDIIWALVPESKNLNHDHKNETALKMAMNIETKRCPQNLAVSKLLLLHGAVPDKRFFLRFGGLPASTSKPGAEFFTKEFFDLAIAAGASLQKEKIWIEAVLTDMADELHPYEALFMALYTQSLAPRTLKDLCISRVRVLLDGRLWYKVDTLHKVLPATVRDDLKLKDHVL